MDEKLTSKIVDWAKEKGILNKSNSQKQFLKLTEEVGELAQGILKRDIAEISDAIGDCIVVLTILAEMENLSVNDCLQGAYDIISKREGKMVDGVFIKN